VDHAHPRERAQRAAAGRRGEAAPHGERARELAVAGGGE
jgi:hypothetical protein